MPDRKPLVQFAALPFKIENGETLVMLITSRETRRWIIPKGRPEKKLKPYEVAAREAMEEAGLIGKVATETYAAFKSEKRLASGRVRECIVRVHLFEVLRELDDWPEKKQRERRWMTPGEAALTVGEPGLVELLLHFGAPRHER